MRAWCIVSVCYIFAQMNALSFLCACHVVIENILYNDSFLLGFCVFDRMSTIKRKAKKSMLVSSLPIAHRKINSLDYVWICRFVRVWLAFNSQWEPSIQQSKSEEPINVLHLNCWWINALAGNFWWTHGSPRNSIFLFCRSTCPHGELVARAFWFDCFFFSLSTTRCWCSCPISVVLFHIK